MGILMILGFAWVFSGLLVWAFLSLPESDDIPYYVWVSSITISPVVIVAVWIYCLIKAVIWARRLLVKEQGLPRAKVKRRPAEKTFGG